MSLFRDCRDICGLCFLLLVAAHNLPAQAPPPAPVGLQATLGDLYVSLTWQPVSGATQYNLYRLSSVNLSHPASANSLPTPISLPPIQYVQGVSATDANVTAGQTYVYQVSAVTPAGETAHSASVSATPQNNLNPVAKMTAPLDGMTITSGTSLTLSATATARAGSISRVDFYADRSSTASVLIGTVTTGPYNLTLQSLPVDSSGHVALRAVATDTGGHTATSASVSLTVDQAVPAGTSLTPAQAVTIARTFCIAVGTPVPDGTPTRAIYKGINPTYWLSVWRVGFLGIASVEVADANSVVTSYFNQALAAQLNATNQTSGEPISLAAAQKTAATVISASGQIASGLMNPQAVANYAPTYADDTWSLRDCIESLAVFRKLWHGTFTLPPQSLLDRSDR